MDFKSFFSPLGSEAREDFAKRCKTTRGHLQNVMYGLKTCADELAVAVERESLGVVRVESLCPRTKWLRLKDKSWPSSDGRPLIDPGAAGPSSGSDAAGAGERAAARSTLHLHREGPSTDTGQRRRSTDAKA